MTDITYITDILFTANCLSNSFTLLKVAVYVPGSKGAPSFVRLYQYPNFSGPTAALANKSFFKADKVTMLWNKRGI